MMHPISSMESMSADDNRRNLELAIQNSVQKRRRKSSTPLLWQLGDWRRSFAILPAHAGARSLPLTNPERPQ